MTQRVPNHGHRHFDDGGVLDRLEQLSGEAVAAGGVGGSGSGTPLDVQEAGVDVVNPATVLNAGHGLDVTDEGGGVAGLAVDETELDGSLIPGIGTGSLGWFNVKDYGAVGDGTTDDTSAIDAAIAALNTATRGVLYFPAGTHKVTAGLTALTAPCLILGDGSGSAAGAASTITTASTTANILGLSASNVTVRGIRFVNTSGAETAGVAVYTTTGYGNHNRYEDLWIEGFRDGMNLLYGGEWAMDGCHITNPVRHGIYIANIDLPDGGDASITNTWIGTRSRNPTGAAIRMDSGGGLKLVNVKINQNSQADQATYGGAKKFVYGLQGAFDTGTSTSILTLVGSSIENVSSDAVNIATTGSGSFGAIDIVGCEFGLYGNSTGYCVKINAAATGGMFTAGGIGQINIDDVVCITDGTARAAIDLIKTDGTILGPAINLNGFNARYTSSGDTNTYDATGVQSFGTPTITYGTAAAGSATTGVRTDATIAKPTAPDVDFSADVTNNNVTSGHHGLAPKAPADATQFLNGAATPAFAQVKDSDLSTTDITTNNVSTSKHGFAPKAPNDATMFLNGLGAYSVPPGTAPGPDHEHVMDCLFSGDGATTAWELPAAPFDAYSVSAYVGGSLTEITLSGTMLTTATFGSAPASGTNNIRFDIVAVLL